MIAIFALNKDFTQIVESWESQEYYFWVSAWTEEIWVYENQKYQ